MNFASPDHIFERKDLLLPSFGNKVSLESMLFSSHLVRVQRVYHSHIVFASDLPDHRVLILIIAECDAVSSDTNWPGELEFYPSFAWYELMGPWSYIFHKRATSNLCCWACDLNVLWENVHLNQVVHNKSFVLLFFQLLNFLWRLSLKGDFLHSFLSLHFIYNLFWYNFWS